MSPQWAREAPDSTDHPLQLARRADSSDLAPFRCQIDSASHSTALKILAARQRHPALTRQPRGGRQPGPARGQHHRADDPGACAGWKTSATSQGSGPAPLPGRCALELGQSSELTHLEGGRCPCI